MCTRMCMCARARILARVHPLMCILSCAHPLMCILSCASSHVHPLTCILSRASSHVHVHVRVRGVRRYEFEIVWPPMLFLTGLPPECSSKERLKEK